MSVRARALSRDVRSMNRRRALERAGELRNETRFEWHVDC
jgi:hypothetical protein